MYVVDAAANISTIYTDGSKEKGFKDDCKSDLNVSSRLQWKQGQYTTQTFIEKSHLFFKNDPNK